MVIDTSVIIAIMLEEPGFEELAFKMASTELRQISAVSYLEASMVLLTKRGDGAEEDLDHMLSVAGIVIMPVTVSQALLARTAFRLYGKGRHRAGLSFGDCFSYALAKQAGGRFCSRETTSCGPMLRKPDDLG